MRITERFNEAVAYAAFLHRYQKRKASNIPYLTHLLAVASLVMGAGGTEDQVIAGLLHDAVEDQGGMPVLEDIRKRFGPQVAQIVDGCTDSYSMPKKPWLERKQAYIARLETESKVTLLVSLADKVDNARAIIRDLREDGESTWKKFNGGKDGTLWYYREIADVFTRRIESPLSRELARLVDEMHSFTVPH